VWDRETGTISYVAPVDTSLFVTGADRGDGVLAGDDEVSAQAYGSDLVVCVDLRQGREIVLRAVPRP
jgi:hypothetical protein